MTCARLRCTLTVSAMLVAHCCAHGALLPRDLHVPGDGLLTYDTVSRREWLDLTESQNIPLAEVELELMPGGNLFGFNLATIGDVEELALSAGYVLFNQYSAADYPIAEQLIELLAETSTYKSEIWLTPGGVPDLTFDYRISDGLARADAASKLTTSYTIASLLIYERLLLSDNSYAYAGPRFAESADEEIHSFQGVWLYREAFVPEPASCGLFSTMIAVATLFGRRRLS